MNTNVKRPENLFAKIDSVFARASLVFNEIPSEAISLARNVGSQKNVEAPVTTSPVTTVPKLK